MVQRRKSPSQNIGSSVQVSWDTPSARAVLGAVPQCRSAAAGLCETNPSRAARERHSMRSSIGAALVFAGLCSELSAAQPLAGPLPAPSADLEPDAGGLKALSPPFVPHPDADYDPKAVAGGVAAVQDVGIAGVC